jgi:hypothetical protein
MKSLFRYRTHAAEAEPIWLMRQTRSASTFSRPIGANGLSMALKAFESGLVGPAAAPSLSKRAAGGEAKIVLEPFLCADELIE